MSDLPLTPTRFLGATVVAFDSSAGWNGDTASCTITLVEDPLNQDQFFPPEVGTPVQFAMGNYRFEGLLQKFQKQVNNQANPVYEVVLNDPRDLLSGIQVILDAYTGVTDMVPNLLNVYGYWENQLGFGGSMVNASGMIWDTPFEILKMTPQNGITITPAKSHVGIKTGIEQLTASASGPFGGPILFKDHSYRVDFSGLPAVPAYYRIANSLSVSILDLVSHLCADAGYDFMVYLEDGVIKFRSVNRTQAPNLGAIAQFVESQSGVVSKSYGRESRTDTTNAVLLGGNVLDLINVYNPGGNTTIWPFWGLDVNNAPIVGQGQPEIWHTMNLNAAEIADIVGDLIYPCDLVELRCALIDFDSWSAYVMKWHPDKAAAINLHSAIDSTSDLQEVFPDAIFQRDLISENDEDLYYFGRMNESDYWTHRAHRVYEFVSQYASQYFGKKWLVKIPFLFYWKIEPETAQLISSEDISQAGGYSPEGSQPLGLAYQDIDNFLAEDGLFQCFVQFPYSPLMDLQKLDPSSYVVSNGSLYLAASVERQIYYPGGSIYPYCVVTLNDAVYELATDPLGGVRDLAGILNVSVDQIIEAAGIRHGSFPVRIHPPPYRPSGVAVPLKSNRRCYGPWGTFAPWGKSGVAGKVDVERDESLTPWECGDYATMNQMGQAKFAEKATSVLTSETAEFTLLGLPLVSLGEVLVQDGPNVTNISVNIGSNGVTTIYRMQTYTPRFGAFSRANAERMNRLGLLARQLRKNIRNLFYRSRSRAVLNQRATLGFMANTARAVAQQTPLDTIYGTVVHSERYGYRTQVSHATIQEFVANIRTDNADVYQSTGGMGLEGLYRPFSVATSVTSEDGLAHFETPTGFLAATATTTQSANPYKNCDIDIMVNGTQYKGHLHRLKGPVDGANARLIGHRGPMTLVGWGREVTGKPVPNAGDETRSVYNWSDKPATDPQLHPEKWRAGIIDLRWDNWRKVWTIPTVVFGVLQADLADGEAQHAKMAIQVKGATIDQVDVYNFFGGTLTTGTKVTAAYDALADQWKVIAASCQA